MLKTVVLLNIFVESIAKYSLIYRKEQDNFLSNYLKLRKWTFMSGWTRFHQVQHVPWSTTNQIWGTSLQFMSGL